MNRTERMLQLKSAVCGYRQGKKEKIVLEGVSFSVKPGTVTCVLGRNGIGKTTLFRSVMGGIPLLGGMAEADGKSIQNMSVRERAALIGYVPQSHTPPFSYTVRQIAVMGRTSHIDLFAAPSAADYDAADRALRQVGISHLADRSYTEISGGERQLALIARALTQNPAYLIMDEPSASLDFGNRIRLLEQVRALAEDGRGVLLSTHEPEQAFRAADDVLLLFDRKRFVYGPVEEILTEEAMNEIYGIQTRILSAPAGKEGVIRTVAGYLKS